MIHIEVEYRGSSESEEVCVSNVHSIFQLIHSSPDMALTRHAMYSEHGLILPLEVGSQLNSFDSIDDARMVLSDKHTLK